MTKEELEKKFPVTFHESVQGWTNGVRDWQIVNFAKVACGGTHIKRTGEIGEIVLKRKNIGHGKERIEIYVQ